MEVTLLEENQIFGENIFGENRLEIFKKYGTKAAMTDFAILLGGYFNINEYYLENRTGIYWTKTADGKNYMRTVNFDGTGDFECVIKRFVGARPALPHSSISSISMNGVSRRIKNDILEIEYGYYPQTAVSKNMQEELEENFQNNNLSITKNSYTTESKKYDELKKIFKKYEHKEYEYKGKRYIRIIDDSYFSVEFSLSSGDKYRYGDIVWVEVEPIKWLVDEKTGIMITEKIICAGIQFNNEINYKGDFENTNMYKYLNTHFIKDIQQNIQKDIEIKLEYEKSKQEIELENIEKTKQKILNLRKKINL